MTRKMSRFTLIISVFLVSFCFLSPVISAANMQEKDAKTYKQAYNLILEEKWEEAYKTLAEFIHNYSRSAWVDDARFWQCYAMEKLDYSLDEVYNCYLDFIRSFPKSKWVDDAEANIIRIARQLAKRGMPEYEAIIKSLEKNADLEIKLAALHALEDMGDLHAEIVPFLTETAITEKDASLAKAAVYILEDIDCEEVLPALKKIMKEAKSFEVRKAALLELDDIEDPEAVSALAEIDSKKARAALVEILKKK